MLFRILDFVLAILGLLCFSPIFLLISLLGWFDTGAPIFKQERLGRNQQPFILFKFRTMHQNTASVPSHLADSLSITTLGIYLRRSKLDELPQLWNVLLGQMSFVGPRPGLLNQPDLTRARAALDIYAVRPGITGLAQLSGIDMSTPELLAKTDAQMLSEMNLRNYFKFILMTALGRGVGDGVQLK